MKIIAAARTHIGRRQNNEDAFLVRPDHGLFVVADGMGGYEGGEVASRLVVGTVETFFELNACDGDTTWPHRLDEKFGFVANELSTAIVLAHREVMRGRRGTLRQMGSTVVAFARDAEMGIIAHLGDSRAYRWRNGELERVARDQSYAEMMRAAGAESAMGFGHVITRAVGKDDEGPPELRRVELRVGDGYLLCSDGVTDVLSDADIAALLLEHADPELACGALVQSAYLAGGHDNITVVVLEVTDENA